MAAIETDVLLLGLDDWVHFDFIVSLWREARPGSGKSELVELAISTIDSLVGQGLVEVGELERFSGGLRFRCWEGDAPSVSGRIRKVALETKEEDFIGVCWLNLTDEGNHRAMIAASR